MKKIYAVIIMLAAIVVAQPAQAQVNIGLRGGLNISNMSLNKDVFDVSNRAGFFIGPSLKLGFGSIGADISALYDQREAKVNDETIKQKNIVIPINARVNIGLGAACISANLTLALLTTLPLVRLPMWIPKAHGTPPRMPSRTSTQRTTPGRCLLPSISKR